MKSKSIYVLIFTVLILALLYYTYQNVQQQKLEQDQLFFKKVGSIELPLKEKIDMYYLQNKSESDVFVTGYGYDVWDSDGMSFRFSLYNLADKECESSFNFNTQNEYWYRCRLVATNDIKEYWKYKKNELISLVIQKRVNNLSTLVIEANILSNGYNNIVNCPSFPKDVWQNRISGNLISSSPNFELYDYSYKEIAQVCLYYPHSNVFTEKEFSYIRPKNFKNIFYEYSADAQNNIDKIKIIDSDKTTVLKTVKLPYGSYPGDSGFYDFNSTITTGWAEYY